jgi:hypothetical protein
MNCRITGISRIGKTVFRNSERGKVFLAMKYRGRVKRFPVLREVVFVGGVNIRTYIIKSMEPGQGFCFILCDVREPINKSRRDFLIG